MLLITFQIYVYPYYVIQWINSSALKSAGLIRILMWLRNERTVATSGNEKPCTDDVIINNHLLKYFLEAELAIRSNGIR